MQIWHKNINLIFEHSFSERQSWLATYFVPVYSIILIIVSLTPFSGWRWPLDFFGAFLHYPLPYYVTRFDNIANLLIYIPLGISVALSLRQQALTQLSAFVVSCIYCSLLSLCIELTQQFLPTRVASNLDLITNSAGGLIGAIIGISIARTRWLNNLLNWRSTLIKFGATADIGIILLFLWLISQINPSIPLFAILDLQKQNLFQLRILLVPPIYILHFLEFIFAFFYCLGVGLFLQSLLKDANHRTSALILLFCCAILLKMLFAGLMLNAADFFEWLALPSVIGMLLSYLLLTSTKKWGMTRISLYGMISLAIVNLLIYFYFTRLSIHPQSNILLWNFGHLSSFTGLSYHLSLLWPISALICLMAQRVAEEKKSQALQALRKLKAKK